MIRGLLCSDEPRQARPAERAGRAAAAQRDCDRHGHRSRRKRQRQVIIFNVYRGILVLKLFLFIR